MRLVDKDLSANSGKFQLTGSLGPPHGDPGDTFCSAKFLKWDDIPLTLTFVKFLSNNFSDAFFDIHSLFYFLFKSSDSKKYTLFPNLFGVSCPDFSQVFSVGNETSRYFAASSLENNLSLAGE